MNWSCTSHLRRIRGEATPESKTGRPGSLLLVCYQQKIKDRGFDRSQLIHVPIVLLQRAEDCSGTKITVPKCAA
jgi:hypothetical protein